MNPAIQGLILFLLLIASAFFSSAETAFTTVNKIQIQLLADDGQNKKASKTLWILDHSDKMLCAILIGNNVVNLSASALATTLTISLVGNTYVGIVTGILTLFVLVFGEIIPKSLATVYSLRLSLLYTPIVWLLMLLLTPAVLIINSIQNTIMKPLGIEASGKVNPMTEEELKTLVDVAHEESAIENDEFQMINNVFRLDDSLAKDIMIPRMDIIFVPINATKEELLRIYREYNYTRYPVYNGNMDTVIGILNVKDLLNYPKNEPFQIGKIMREPHFTFEHKEVGTLLIEMREEAISLSIVLDEYGATSGIVTLEDILEEIVGEIRDEFDNDEIDSIRQLSSENEYLIDGSTNLDDVNEALEIDLKSEEYDSLGGYMIESLDRLPKSGESLVLSDGTRLIAEVVKRNRIEKIHIILP